MSSTSCVALPTSSVTSPDEFCGNLIRLQWNWKMVGIGWIGMGLDGMGWDRCLGGQEKSWSNFLTRHMGGEAGTRPGPTFWLSSWVLDDVYKAAASTNYHNILDSMLILHYICKLTAGFFIAKNKSAHFGLNFSTRSEPPRPSQKVGPKNLEFVGVEW